MDSLECEGSHVHLWKKCNRPCETNGWSSNSMNTLERKAIDGVSTRHWLRSPILFGLIKEKLVLNVDLEQIETNFSFIVYSLCNLYRTFRIWDSSSITFLITVHRKKGPSHGEMYCKLPLCWVHQNNYEGLKKNSLYRISTVEKKPQRLYPVRFNLSWWAERNGIYNLYIP